MNVFHVIRMRRVGLLVALALPLVQASACGVAGSPTAPAATVPSATTAPSPSPTPAPAATPRPLALDLVATIREGGRPLAPNIVDIALDGNRLYLPLGTGGLVVYDVSDPSRPVRRAQVGVDILRGLAGAVAVSGTRAFVATAERGTIAELDLSDLDRSLRVRSFGDGVFAEHLALRGGRLYAHSLFESPSGVFVFDVQQDPALLLGQYLGDRIQDGFAVSESGTAFLARYDDVLDVVDMATPAAPRRLLAWPFVRPSLLRDLDGSGSRLYGAAQQGGLWAFDIANPARLALRTTFEDSTATAVKVRMRQPYVFVAWERARGVSFFQALLDDGQRLQPVWSRPSDSTLMSIAVSEELLALAEFDFDSREETVRLFRLYR